MIWRLVWEGSAGIVYTEPASIQTKHARELWTAILWTLWKTRKRKGETIVENCLAFLAILIKTPTASWPNFESVSLNTPPRNYVEIAILGALEEKERERRKRGRAGGRDTIAEVDWHFWQDWDYSILPNLSIMYAQVVRFWIYVRLHHWPKQTLPTLLGKAYTEIYVPHFYICDTQSCGMETCALNKSSIKRSI